jgi:uncharacterized membrane protein (UPF0182 family)
VQIGTNANRTTSNRHGQHGRVRSSWTLLGLGIVAVLLLIWPSAAGFYTDWLWFHNLGFGVVFSTVLVTKLSLGLAIGLIAAALAWLNLRLALRLSPVPDREESAFRVSEEGLPVPDPAILVPRIILPASLVIGAFSGMFGWGSWDTFLRFRHQQPFGEADPIFGRDIGFYFFTLPVLDIAAGLLFALSAVSLIGAAAVYVVRSAGKDGGVISCLRQRGPRAHILGLASAFFLILAWQAYLSMPNLLYSTAGPVAGAGYTDVAARLPLLWVKFFAALLASALALVCVFRVTNRMIWAGVAAYALSLVGGAMFPAMLQRFSVAPNELVKETPYIRLNIAATRKAFGLDGVQERELSGEKTLSAQDIQDNQRTIQNIRLWDQQPLLDTFGQIQEIRTYYEFQSVDNDRYRINGEMQQVMLSPRELSAASLPNRNWINERLTFTHGFGLTVGPVAKATGEGLPVLFVKDIPPASTIPSLNVDRPEIYFGEMSNSPVYVKTNVKEFNHPAGEDNVFTRYAGHGGVSVGSTWRQLLFATRFADLKLLLSNDLTADSRVLYHRGIRERLGKVAPFLHFDGDPYLVISEGRLFWINDAYTISDRYPYSQPVGRGINYIRNSVKAVVDAYHGDVRLYIADERDPVIQTYARIFPEILRPLAEMPAGLREHLRYPEDIFKIQTAVYSTYHMDQPQVFYNKEDQWTVASVTGSGDKTESQVMEPYYTIMKLPQEQTEEFILMLPFTPQRKDNLAAWMVARADGEHYGQLVVYRFPKQRLIFGPKQVTARINQDPEISRQITLWSQHGSQVILGTLMVIPIKESLIYVQPLYLRAVTGKIPELRRVIVVAENRIAMEPTLDASLARVFGNAPPSGAAPSGQILTSIPATDDRQATVGAHLLNAQAKMHYDRMLQAQRDGDWARFGEELKQLGSVIERLANQR